MSTNSSPFVRVAVDERPDLLERSVSLIETNNSPLEAHLPELVVTSADAVPTQVANPRRTTLRTVVQLLLAIASALPQIVPIILGYWDPVWLSSALAQVLAVQAAVTRIMALPGVNAWLTAHLPWLAAIPSVQIPAR